MDQNIKEHTVKSYDKDLQSIADTINDLVGLAKQSLEMVENVIKNPEGSSVDEISRHDYKINNLDNLVEKKVVAMLALRQPVAIDLRYVVSSLKVSSNLERIGDKAKSVIKKIYHIGHRVIDSETKKSLLKMLTLSKEMVENAVIAFNSNDAKKANEILKADDKIDAIYDDLFKLIDNDNFNRDQVKTMVNILFIAKSFERVADHSVNIAEITNYVVTGEIVDD